MQRICTFNQFNLLNENIDSNNKDMGQTHLMTLNEYKEKVTPVLKEYNKFITKNRQYFKPIGYYGLKTETYTEFVISEINRLVKGGFKTLATKEYVTEKWIESGRVTDEIPQEINNKYSELIEKLTVLFGEQISKVQSDETNNNKRSVRRAIDNDYYIDAMLDDVLNPQRLEEILKSVGLKMSKRLSDMKYKVEHEGYKRSYSNEAAERNKEFAKKISSILKEEEVVLQLKDRKRNDIISLCDRFDSEGNNDIYEFSKRVQKGNPGASSILYKLYTGDKNDYSRKSPLFRVDRFDELVEEMCNAYVEAVISRFINRANKKLAVINKNLGLPDVKIGHFTVNGDIEGEVDLVWSNGYELKLKARIILAGGTYQVVLHERYLMHFFKDGKKIEIEQIDQVQ